MNNSSLMTFMEDFIITPAIKELKSLLNPAKSMVTYLKSENYENDLLSHTQSKIEFYLLQY